jgi:hypothetical protein
LRNILRRLNKVAGTTVATMPLVMSPRLMFWRPNSCESQTPISSSVRSALVEDRHSPIMRPASSKTAKTVFVLPVSMASSIDSP